MPVSYPVLYLDGEMAHDDNSKRIIGLCGKIPGKLHILNHEVLFCQGALVMNLANQPGQPDRSGNRAGALPGQKNQGAGAG